MKTRALLPGGLAAISLLATCGGCLSLLPVTDFESALRHLEGDLLPRIQIDNSEPRPAGTLAMAGAALPLAERLPPPEAYPLQGIAGRGATAGGSLPVEIVSSVEKADAARPDRRWLVQVAERFNQRGERSDGGRRIEVRIRTIPSGLAAQMLAAGTLRPAGYSPASEQWLELLRQQGVPTRRLEARLVGNGSVIALRNQAWRRLGAHGSPTFAGVVDQALAGRLRMGYCNPYICSPGLDFLHTLLWLSAGHSRDGKALTAADLQSDGVSRSFALFQQSLTSTAPTYLEMVETWRRNPSGFDAMVMAHQTYLRLKREPGFGDLQAVPFGSPQDSPLAALPWTTAEQRQALERFAAFATSPAMQELARQADYSQAPPVPPEARPPRADGDLLSQAQRQWKRRKDGRRTVYMQLVIDRSGSMQEHGRMQQLKKAVSLATAAINPGNQVGLISFSDHPQRHLALQPYDNNVRNRLLAAVSELQPDGPTALYDGLAVAMADLMRARRRDPSGRFVVLLLTDGNRTEGLALNDLKPVLRHSAITVLPIAYGEVNQGELSDIAAIREGAVYQGTPERIVPLINDLLQTNL